MFEEIFIYMDSIGFVEVIAPFLIVFILIYAILEKTKIFEKKNVNIIIGIVMGLLVVVPHITGIGPDVVPIINVLIPSFALIIIAVVSLSLVLAAIGIDPDAEFFINFVTILILIDLVLPDILIISLIAKAMGFELPPILDFLRSDTLFIFSLIAAVGGGVIYFITKE